MYPYLSPFSLPHHRPYFCFSSFLFFLPDYPCCCSLSKGTKKGNHKGITSINTAAYTPDCLFIFIDWVDIYRT